MESSALPLSSWESFYVIVGSSAAALTGLQFVVITLGKELNVLGSGHATRAFGTPTVVHFCMVLLVAAILSAPWPGVFAPAVLLGTCGGLPHARGADRPWSATVSWMRRAGAASSPW